MSDQDLEFLKFWLWILAGAMWLYVLSDYVETFMDRLTWWFLAIRDWLFWLKRRIVGGGGRHRA